MDNLRQSIKVYFEEFDPELILTQETFRTAESFVGQDDFQSLSRHIFAMHNRTEDEREALYRKVSEDWTFEPGKQYNSKASKFYLLTHFNEQILKELESEPFVHYIHLLKWRDLAFKLGEDIFTTSFLAYRDIAARKERKYFSWRPVLFSDNTRLHSLLEKGIAENHAHLWASSLTFDLNWLALMNHYPFFREKVLEFKHQNRLGHRNSNGLNNNKIDFDVQLKKAIALRLVLYKSLNFYERQFDLNGYSPMDSHTSVKNLRDYLRCHEVLGFDIAMLTKPSNEIDSFEFLMNFDKIQAEIVYLGRSFGLKLPHNGDNKVVDYLINQNISPSNFEGCYFLAGERQLLYRAFKVLYSGLGNKRDVALFENILHAYLAFKNNLRREIIPKK